MTCYLFLRLFHQTYDAFSVFSPYERDLDKIVDEILDALFQKGAYLDYVDGSFDVTQGGRILYSFKSTDVVKALLEKAEELIPPDDKKTMRFVLGCLAREVS